MKPETRKKLDSLIWRSRIRPVVSVAAMALVLVGIFAYLYWPDTPVSERVVLGTVSNWTQPQTSLRSRNAVITVLLEDGRSVVATSASNRAPQVGQSITLVEWEYASGRVSYTWNE